MVAAMSDEDSRIRTLVRRWDGEDAARAKQEERAQQLFLEAEANQTFGAIEEFLTRLGKVLSAASASVEIDTAWEHLGERRLRRVARIISSDPPRQLRLEFTIQGICILYHDRAYPQLSGGIKALLPVVTADVEQFLSRNRTG
jgi:hypothetical protein